MLRVVKTLPILVLVVMVAACSVDSGSQGADDGTNDGGPSVVVDGWFGDDGDISDDDVTGDAVTPEDEADPSKTSVLPDNYSALEITTDALERWKQGESHAQKLTAKGGSGQYVWSATGLPDGLAVHASRIKGETNAEAKGYPVTITLTDEKTEEQIKRDLTLYVDEHVEENIKIRVSQYVNGAWQEVPAQSGMIKGAFFSAEKPRLKLEVLKDDGTDEAASARRFHWSKKDERSFNLFSPGIYVPPSLDGSEGKIGQTAYLMPWTEGLTGERSLLDLIARWALGGDKAKTGEAALAVVDDFGNKASIKIDDIDIEEAGATQERMQDIACNRQHAELEVVGDFHGELRARFMEGDNVVSLSIRAKGGVPPYSWSMSPSSESWWLKADTAVTCNEDSANCEVATIKLSNIVIKGLDPVTQDATINPPVFLRDACGDEVKDFTKFVYEVKDDKIGDMFTMTAQMRQALHTTEGTELQFDFYSGGKLVAKSKFELDPVPTDDPIRPYNVKPCDGSTKNGNCMWIEPGKEKTKVRDIDKIILRVTDTPGKPVEFGLGGVRFYSERWVYDWSGYYMVGAYETELKPEWKAILAD